MASRRHWVIVAARDHARRGLTAGFIMANHGKRSPLARISPGDGVLIYSPTTTHPNGKPLRAVTIVGEVTGDEPEPSDVILGGFRRQASLREIEPIWALIARRSL
jgi:EVE domain